VIDHWVGDAADDRRWLTAHSLAANPEHPATTKETT
jgi:hypothetical protein